MEVCHMNGSDLVTSVNAACSSSPAAAVGRTVRNLVSVLAFALTNGLRERRAERGGHPQPR